MKSKRRRDEIDVEEIEKEIAEIDAKLETYERLLQRRRDLVMFGDLANKLWGIHQPPSRGKTAEVALRVLLSQNSAMDLNTLLEGMRRQGWKDSGNDARDKKRLYVAICKSKHFVRDGERWKAQGSRPAETERT
jgi:hypothetical protein